ncbi:hypothetical protein H9650_11455 [Psychrobacillus sp. Sa2BUA9]|uniref:Uncharacterized protein n=1 Tax=Psychrobacillus faecigallinarum TaxID=2762235 RepID=A0ABR8RA98_9BACI|nr:hypothetical protein [Psychrobacillus faecigallinarum]MBD7944732.1 hypothetical protein [Psychrobacillus faecigallinarum]
MKSIEFIISIIGAIATSGAAIAAWLAAQQAKKNTELTQVFNNKNDLQKRSEVKPLLEIVKYGTEKEGYQIGFKNLGFQTILFLEASITSESLKKVEFFDDIQKCEISLSEDGLVFVNLNKVANTGTLQKESQLSIKYKTIYNDVITDVYHLHREVSGIPVRTNIEFGYLVN